DRVLLPDIEDADDVGMVERRSRLRLAREAGEVNGVERIFRRENLDRHAPIQPRVARRVNLPHSACAERRQDFVGAEAAPGWKSHFGCAGLYSRESGDRGRTPRLGYVPERMTAP